MTRVARTAIPTPRPNPQGERSNSHHSPIDMAARVIESCMLFTKSSFYRTGLRIKPVQIILCLNYCFWSTSLLPHSWFSFMHYWMRWNESEIFCKKLSTLQKGQFYHMHTVIKAKNEVRLMKNNLILHVISTSLSGSTKMKIMVLINKRNDHLWFLTYDWHHEWKKDTALAWLIPTNTAIHLMTLDHSPLWESGLLIDRWRSRHGYRSPINTRKKE